jgi:hypothetical protein
VTYKPGGTNFFTKVKEKNRRLLQFDYYFNQIKKTKFRQVPMSIFRTIQYEGLDEETGKLSMTDWNYIELKLKKEDKEGLMNMKRQTIEEFNRFDIALKDKYRLGLIDLIDYEHGRIFIVR